LHYEIFLCGRKCEIPASHPSNSTSESEQVSTRRGSKKQFVSGVDNAVSQVVAETTFAAFIQGKNSVLYSPLG
jgi:hypothetical protein